MGDRNGIRGRKGAGLTNLLGGVAECVCGAPMRLVRKGSHNNYLYLMCSAAKEGKCKHRKLHRYQPLEAEIQRLFGEIAFGKAPRDDGQAALRARIVRMKRQAADIESRYNASRRRSGKARTLASARSDWRRWMASTARSWLKLLNLKGNCNQPSRLTNRSTPHGAL